MLFQNSQPRERKDNTKRRTNRRRHQGLISRFHKLSRQWRQYADELRKPEPYFKKIETKADADAVISAVDLIEEQSGKFEPQKLPNEYALAVHELVQAKIEQRAPEVEIETEKRDRVGLNRLALR